MAKFTRVERAAISKEFRESIQQYGLENAIASVMDSSSEKVPVRKTVLAQQCRKPSFAAEFNAACDRLIKQRPLQAVKIMEFKGEITGH